MKEKILILDTEALGKENKLIYDLGYLVAVKGSNGDFEAIAKHQEIVKQLYDNKLLFKSDYYKIKRPLYVSLLKGKKAKRKYFGWIIYNLRKIIKQHNIKIIYAYNSQYDLKALDDTAKHFRYKLKIDGVRWIDLMAVANNYIHTTIEYSKFANENKLYTKKGFYKLGVEETYKFIKNDPKLKTPHTSLQDCEIELEILNVAIKNGYEIGEPLYKRFPSVKE